MPERNELKAHDINGQNSLKARLQERILQLSELNRACLLGIELTLLSTQNAKKRAGSMEDKIKGR
jgi:hypothetical protein